MRTGRSSSKQKGDAGKTARRHGKPSMADLADRHALYEASVQDVSAEYDFIDKTFHDLRGRPAQVLREDFCGTANMCCEWVRRRRTNTAVGVDIDPEVLDWGNEHHVSKLKPSARQRVRLIQADVRAVSTEPADVVLAMNFSYQLFRQRTELRSYFSTVREHLADDGVLFMDAYGGYDAYREIREKSKHNGFTYIWDQASYNPITGYMTCHIDFSFPDGSKMKRAFTYHWRLWTLPELRELLDEAGYSRVTVYWQGTDEASGEGNGIFNPATVGDADPGWICFLTAEK
jgi:cyclopropane fatty-acyl-phospholipid synthase-like methyltransferase